MKEMESIVNECLIEHEGGEKFFDAIDEKLRDDNLLISMMINKVLEKEEFDFIITSGKFGKVFKEFSEKYMSSSFNQKVITVNGSLRKDSEVIDYSKKYDVSNKRVIFIDDSYYLGRTKEKIKASLEKNNATLISTYVFYDESKIKDENVHSFYRYYDHYE